MNKFIIYAIFVSFIDAKTVWRKKAAGDLDGIVTDYTDILTNWFAFLPSYKRWIRKIGNVSQRMQKSYDNCGFNDIADSHNVSAYNLPRTITTPNLYEYHHLLGGLAANDISSIRLKLDGIDHDAHIGLGHTSKHDGQKWEILLGGWDGTMSMIRPCNQCSVLVKRKHTKMQLKQWLARLEIQIDNGLIKVIGGKRRDEILIYESKEIKKGQMRNLVVSSGYGAYGNWTVTNLSFGQKLEKMDTIEELSFRAPDTKLNPFKKISTLTNALVTWSNENLAGCRGQRRNLHHANRLTKWRNILQSHLINHIN